MPRLVRPATADDLGAADRVVCRAYIEYEAEFPQWMPYLRTARPMTDLAREAEVLVAAVDGAIAGTVGYVAPGRPRYACFPPEWAILRMMAVDPDHRGRGVARMLVEECVRLAKRDGAQILGLFTSPAMKTAVALYRRAGFQREFAIDPVMGMPCEVFALRLA